MWLVKTRHGTAAPPRSRTPGCRLRGNAPMGSGDSGKFGDFISSLDSRFTLPNNKYCERQRHTGNLEKYAPTEKSSRCIGGEPRIITPVQAARPKDPELVATFSQ